MASPDPAETPAAGASTTQPDADDDVDMLPPNADALAVAHAAAAAAAAASGSQSNVFLPTQDSIDDAGASITAELQVNNRASEDPDLDGFQPGTAETQIKPTGPPPVVYLATYSNVPVFELTVRGIGVMRRRSDGYLNATQILKLAGVDKGKRTKVLEKEILTGEHEKVQGGYGKYQGTWIPLKRAEELAFKYNVAHLLESLLGLDPKGEVPLAGRKKRPNPNAPSASMYHRNAAAKALAEAAANASAPPPPGQADEVDEDDEEANSAPQGRLRGQPSQQPRFLQLRPPPGLESQSRPDASAFIPHGMDNLVELNSSRHGLVPAEAPVGIPAGSTETTRELLESYEAHGYQPRGVALPSKRSAEDVAGNGAAGKRVRTVSPTSLATLGPSPVKDLNTLGPSGGSLRSATRPRSGRMAVGTPSEIPSEAGGPRYADRPVVLRLDDDGDTRVREVLTGLFKSTSNGVDDRTQPNGASNGASSYDTSLKDLDDLLAQLKRASSLGGQGPPATEPRTTLIHAAIDEHGHTALHWASALCRLQLIQALTVRSPAEGGANVHIGNFAGETPLQRSVLVKNAYDSSSFPALLSVLAPSLHTRDYKRRTLLHHIALTAALPGRASPARYYLACVLEYIAKHEGGQYASLVDAQDEDGETVLGIVARIGNASMAQMLLNVNARQDLPNVFGIRPIDWQIDSETDPNRKQALVASAGGSGPQQTSDSVVASFVPPPKAPIAHSKDIMRQLDATLKDLQMLYDSELTSKTEALATAQSHLQAATRELSSRRRAIASSLAPMAGRDEVRQRLANLQRIVCTTLGLPEDSSLSVQQLLQRATNAGFLDSVTVDDVVLPANAASSEAETIAGLRWLAAWYEKECDDLRSRISGLDGANAAKESQCRKVVALCCGIDESQVEGMLDALVTAVETDGHDVDLSRVAGFLDKVKRSGVGSGQVSR